VLRDDKIAEKSFDQFTTGVLNYLRKNLGPEVTSLAEDTREISF